MLLGVGAAALAFACGSSSGTSPSAFGDPCTVYAVGQACSGDYVCKCALTVTLPEGDCFCTQSCDVPDNCPNDAGSCLAADDPSQPTLEDGTYCFNFLPDGGPLP